MYKVAEEGDLAGVLEEILPEKTDPNLIERLDEAISILYQDRVEKALSVKSGIEINDPESFYCKHFE